MCFTFSSRFLSCLVRASLEQTVCWGATTVQTHRPSASWAELYTCQPSSGAAGPTCPQQIIRQGSKKQTLQGVFTNNTKYISQSEKPCEKDVYLIRTGHTYRNVWNCLRNVKIEVAVRRVLTYKPELDISKAYFTSLGNYFTLLKNTNMLKSVHNIYFKKITCKNVVSQREPYLTYILSILNDLVHLIGAVNRFISKSSKLWLINK